MCFLHSMFSEQSMHQPVQIHKVSKKIVQHLHFDSDFKQNAQSRQVVPITFFIHFLIRIQIFQIFEALYVFGLPKSTQIY